MKRRCEGLLANIRNVYHEGHEEHEEHEEKMRGGFLQIKELLTTNQQYRKEEEDVQAYSGIFVSL